MKRRLAQALVRIYPAAWRREYGAEFADLLAARRLNARVVLDVLWNAAWQQVRLGEPWLLVGIPLLAFNLSQFAILTICPPPYQRDSFTVGWPAALLGILLLLSVGFWTVMRHGPQAKAGRAAMKTAMFTNWPLCLIALLLAAGVMRMITLGPGDSPATFHEQGLTITFYDHARRPAALAGMFLIPFLTLPEALLYGWIGGLLARLTLRSVRNRAPGPERRP